MIKTKDFIYKPFSDHILTDTYKPLNTLSIDLVLKYLVQKPNVHLINYLINQRNSNYMDHSLFNKLYKYIANKARFYDFYRNLDIRFTHNHAMYIFTTNWSLSKYPNTDSTLAITRAWRIHTANLDEIIPFIPKTVNLMEFTFLSITEHPYARFTRRLLEYQIVSDIVPMRAIMRELSNDIKNI